MPSPYWSIFSTSILGLRKDGQCYLWNKILLLVQTSSFQFNALIIIIIIIIIINDNSNNNNKKEKLSLVIKGYESRSFQRNISSTRHLSSLILNLLNKRNCRCIFWLRLNLCRSWSKEKGLIRNSRGMWSKKLPKSSNSSIFNAV